MIVVRVVDRARNNWQDVTHCEVLLPNDTHVGCDGACHYQLDLYNFTARELILALSLGFLKLYLDF